MRERLSWRRRGVSSRPQGRGTRVGHGTRAERLEPRVLLCADMGADVLAHSDESIHFSTTRQSIWGPDGAAVKDTGKLFFGPQWDVDIQPSLGEAPNYVAVDASTSGKIGIDFQAVLDPGSVDASYGGRAKLHVVSGEGNTFTVHSEMEDPAGRLQTRSPNIDIESNFIFEFAARLAIAGQLSTEPVTVTVPWVRWENRCTSTIFGPVCIKVPVPTTRQVTLPAVTLAEFNQEVFDFDFAAQSQLLKLTNNPADPLFAILGIPLIQPEPGSNLAHTFDIKYNPLSVTGVEVSAVDEDNPKEPEKPHTTNPFSAGVKFSMGDITVELGAVFTDQQAFDVGDDGREGLRASGEANVARIDIDADFLATMLFSGTIPPLGASANLTALGIPIFSLSADLLDVDFGPQFSIGQEFEFVPTPWVRLDFSQPVTIGGVPTLTHEMPVGGELDVTFDGAAAGQALDVQPTYFLRNDFYNKTDLKIAPSLDLKVLAMKVSTLLGTLFDEAVYDPPAFVGPSVPLFNLSDRQFELAGFTKVVGDPDAQVPEVEDVLRLVFDGPPVIEPDDLVLSAAVVGEGGQLTLAGTFANRGAGDTHRVSIDWGDGAVTVLDLPAGPRSFGPAGHAYAAGGVYDVTVTVLDDDGLSDDAATRVHVAGAGLRGGVLQIIGTGADDRVEVSTKDTDGDGRDDMVRASANFIPGYHRFFDIAGIEAVHVQTGGGNDKVSMWGSVPADSVVEGGDGADTLYAGRRSILVGGAGADSLNGADGNDVLVPGVTALAGDTGLLLAVLRGTLTLDGDTVFDDAAADTVAGNKGLDTFYLSATDLLRDSYLDRDGPEAFFPV